MYSGISRLKILMGIAMGGIVVIYGMVHDNNEKSMQIHTVKTDLMHSIKTTKDLVSLFPTSAEQIKAQVEQYMHDAQRDVQAIIAIPCTQRTFANTAQALDRIVSYSNLLLMGSISFVLKSVSPDKEIRDAAQEAVKQIQEFYVDTITTNKKMFNAFKEYVEGNGVAEQLTAEQRYFLTETMADFMRSGLNLPDDKLARVKQLSKDLGELSLIFARNIADDNRKIEVDAQGLVGVNPDFIATLARTEKGGYLLGDDYSTREAVMENCDIEDTRHRYYNLFMGRAYPNNHAILEQIIAKRDQLAHILGFASFAHLDTANQMVHNPERAYSFLHDLIKRFAPKAQEELKLWLTDKPASVVLDTQGRIKPWDLSYIKNQYKKKHLAVDEELIARYFPMEKTIQGLLNIYRQFFSIDFKEIPVTGLWHQDVTLVAVYDKNQHIVGYLFLDLYPRDNKFSHACEITVVPAVVENGVLITPAVSVVVANFPKSTATKPSLLKRIDVSTFFHEFGHALHVLCGATTMASFSGTATKYDFVEIPSQMLEEWLTDKDVLRSLSSHYQTGEPLPDTLIDKIIALRTFNSGSYIMQQAFFSLIALDYFAAGEHKDVYGLWTKLSAKMHPQIVPSEQDHFYAAYGHLTGYGPKYYGYLWSKVFAFDLFDTIKQHGLYNAAIGQRYKQEILGKGGSQDPNELLKNFLGREPRSDAFFNCMGLKKEVL